MDMHITPTRDEVNRFFELSLDMLCIATNEGYFKVVNPAFESTLGYTQQELVSVPFVSFVHPDDVDKTIAETLKLAEGVPTIHFQNRYRAKDGSYKWFAWTASPSPEGLLYAVAHDITDEVTLSERLHESEERYRRIVETALEVLIGIDPMGNITFVNKYTLDLFGYTEAEMIGMNVLAQLIVPEMRESTRARIQSRTQGVSEHYELCMYRKDGSRVWVINNATPVYDKNGKNIGSIGAMVDITQRRDAESHIQKQNEALVKANRDLALARRSAEEATRVKSEFLATMSHELRTPLNAIIGYTEIQLAGMTGDLNDEQRDYNKRILVNAENLLDLINEVLDLAKIEAGRIEIEQKPFVIADLLGEVTYQTKGLAANKGLMLETELDSTIPATIIGDYLRIKQIAINLVSNAIKFTDMGTVKMMMQKNTPDTWTLIVSDTGVGIPSHAQEYIFDEFRQVDGSSLRKYGGTGLGLAIVRKLVTMMGGTIRVKSHVGEGSTFTVVLPLIIDPVGE